MDCFWRQIINQKYIMDFWNNFEINQDELANTIRESINQLENVQELLSDF